MRSFEVLATDRGTDPEAAWPVDVVVAIVAVDGESS